MQTQTKFGPIADCILRILRVDEPGCCYYGPLGTTFLLDGVGYSRASTEEGK